MRLAPYLAFCFAAVALGCLGIGLGLAPHLLDRAAVSPGLIDANLAQALAQPIELRSLELAIAGLLGLLICTRKLVDQKLGSSAALAALGLSVLDRLIVLPRVHDAYGKVDMVALRPESALRAAGELGLVHALAAGLTGVLVVVVIGFAVSTLSPPKKK